MYNLWVILLSYIYLGINNKYKGYRYIKKLWVMGGANVPFAPPLKYAPAIDEFSDVTNGAVRVYRQSFELF